MLTLDELKFFTENKEQILDLIRAVDQHEHIRMIVGPGMIDNHSHLGPDYLRSHDIMSRLSNHLNADVGLMRYGGALCDHLNIPERPNFDPTIGISC